MEPTKPNRKPQIKAHGASMNDVPPADALEPATVNQIGILIPIPLVDHARVLLSKYAGTEHPGCLAMGKILASLVGAVDNFRQT